MAGCRSDAPLLMFKVLILQLYNMSDDAAEDIVDDRFAFRRFVSFEVSQKSPEAAAIGRFLGITAQNTIFQGTHNF